MVNGEQRPSGYLRVEFLNQHPELKDIIDSEVITDYLDDCPISVVEYSGTLQNETKKQRKNRMQCHKVYNGDIKELVNGLRNTYPEFRSLSGYGLLLKVYEQIKSYKDLDLELARKQVSNEDNSTVQESASVPETETTSQKPVEQVVEEPVVETTKEQLNIGIQAVDKPEVKESVTSIPTPTTEEVKSPVTEQVSTQPKEIQESINKPLKEEKKMADIKELINTATNTMASGKVEGAALTPTKVDASQKDQKAVTDFLASTMVARNAWTKENKVTAVIMTQQPAAFRTKATSGKAIKAGQDKDAKQVAQEKYLAFARMVSGKQVQTIQEFLGLGDGMFANCIDEANAKKAAAMNDIYSKLYNNPELEIEAFIDKSKATAPIKGYKIGAAMFTTEELIAELIDKANGAVYAEGYYTGDQKEDVFFKIAFATKKQTNVNHGVAQNSTAKQMVITAKNKAKFIKDAANCAYLMTQTDEAAVATANFKAKIVVDGADMNAVCSVWELDKDGNKVGAGTDKNGQPKFKKKLTSINVSVPVVKVVKEVDKEYAGNETQPSNIAARWGITLPTIDTKDFGNVVDMRCNPAYDVMIKLITNQGNASDTVREASETIKAITNLVKENAAAEATSTADELAQ